MARQNIRVNSISSSVFVMPINMNLPPIAAPEQCKQTEEKYIARYIESIV